MATAEDSGSLSGSFTDLMTSLAVIFILLLVALVNNKQRELQITQEELDRIRQELSTAVAATTKTRRELLLHLQQELATLAGRGIEVREDEKDPLGLLVIVPEGLLQFRVNESRIPPLGTQFLYDFIPRLAKTACAYHGDLASVVVEGHTDSNGEDEHNLKLSQSRSLEVVSRSLDVLKVAPVGVDPPLDPQSCFLDLLSASGRGERELFLVNGLEDKPRSRRVVFKLRVRSFEQRGATPFGAPV